MGKPTILIDMDAPQHEWDAFIARLERIAAGEEELPVAGSTEWARAMWARAMCGGGSD